MQPPTDHTPEWDGTIADARALQEQLAGQAVLRDGFRKPLATVAGFSAGSEDGIAWATAVLLDARDLSVLESHAVRMPAPMPRVPGLRSFDELPALLAVLGMLSTPPDLALVGGHGIADPHRFGLASHFGVATGIPSIGVAETTAVGTAAPLHQIRGAYTPVRDAGRQVGWLLRTRVDCDPLVVSPGHQVAMASVADLVMRFVVHHRLPEPMRLAARLASDTGALDAPGEVAD